MRPSVRPENHAEPWPRLCSPRFMNASLVGPHRAAPWLLRTTPTLARPGEPRPTSPIRVASRPSRSTQTVRAAAPGRVVSSRDGNVRSRPSWFPLRRVGNRQLRVGQTDPIAGPSGPKWRCRPKPVDRTGVPNHPIAVMRDLGAHQNKDIGTGKCADAHRLRRRGNILRKRSDAVR